MTKSTTTEIIAKDVKVPSSDIVAAAAAATTTAAISATTAAATASPTSPAVSSNEKKSADAATPLVIDGIELDREGMVYVMSSYDVCHIIWHIVESHICA